VDIPRLGWSCYEPWLRDEIANVSEGSNGVSAQCRRVNCVPQWRGSPGRPVIAGIGTLAVPVM
jgi:hypothetical protein